jgi:hypothetical protein
MARSDKPHVIRLRGPWQVTRSSSSQSVAPATSPSTTDKLSFPARSGHVAPADFRGRLNLRRSFNWLEPLSYCESLWLVVQAAAWPRLSLELNGLPLGTVEATHPLPAAWDITSRVTAHNELQLTWNIDTPATLENQCWVEVQLEVRLEVGR